MKEIILVFLGGGLGSSFRFLLNKIIPNDSFPYSTLIVNLIGSFLIGLIISYLIKNNMLKSDYFLLLVVGICGGLTTFSAFSLENLNLIKSNEIFNSIIYILISVSFCIILTYLGYALMNKILN
ncbi:MAG: fluoride efflux transporter CrcB [Bacteroidota bacterium]